MHTYGALSGSGREMWRICSGQRKLPAPREDVWFSLGPLHVALTQRRPGFRAGSGRCSSGSYAEVGGQRIVDERSGDTPQNDWLAVNLALHG